MPNSKYTPAQRGLYSLQQSPFVALFVCLSITACYYYVYVDGCVYGDYRGLFDVDQYKLSCSEIGSGAQYKCYETNVAEDCCETCPRVRQTANTGKLERVTMHKVTKHGRAFSEFLRASLNRHFSSVLALVPSLDYYY